MKAALLALLLLAPGPAWARKKAWFIEPDDRKAEKRLAADAEEELAGIIAKVERGELPKIQFEFDSDEIMLESYPTLDAVIDLMFRNPKLKLLVLAHTCTIGGEAYNLELSERRAKSVKTFMTQRGIAPPSIRYRGMGYSTPIADNSTEKGRAKNRRVEFRITFREWESVY